MKVTDTARRLCSVCQAGTPAACVHWFIDHDMVNDPPPHRQREVIDVAWTIVKDHKAMKAEGHERAYNWAREYLGLTDRDEVVATRHPYDPEEDINEATLHV